MSRARLALIGLYALGDACLLGVGLTALGPPNAHLPLGTAILLTALVIAGVALARVRITAANVDRGARIGVLAAIFAVLVFFFAAYAGRSLTAIGAGVIAALILWWRGMSLGGDEFHPDGARMRLWLGLVIVTVFAMVIATPALIFVYVAACLLALQIANLVSVGSRSDIDPRALGRPRWVRAVLAIEASILVLILAEMLIFNLEVISRLMQLAMLVLIAPFALLVALVGSLVLLIISPESIAELMRRLSEFLQARMGMLGGAGSDLQALPTTADPVSPYVSVALLVALIVSAIVLVILVASAARIAQRRRAALAAGDTPEAAPALSEAEGPAAAAARGMRTRISRLFASATIRLIYARMSSEAARRGERRPPALTPFEYLPALGRAFPGADDETRVVTDAYVAAHYGEVPDSLDKLRAIQFAWTRARQTAPPPPQKPAVPTQAAT